MLQPQKNRQPLTRGGWRLAAVLALGVSLPLAAVGIAPQPIAIVNTPMETVTPQVAPTVSPINAERTVEVVRPARTVRPSQTSFSGHLQDQTGGRLPGVTVTLTNQQTQETRVAVTNASGAFQFVNLPAANYQLVAELPGFRKVGVPVDLSAGTPTILTVTMPVGALTETITVACKTTASSILQMFFPTLSAQEPVSTPIRVGGNIKAPRKTKDVRPVCPAGGVTGDMVVLLEGHIGVDGFVTDIKSLGSDAVPAELTESAKDAVLKWEFTPTLLNGSPVEVTITVTVNFTRG